MVASAPLTVGSQTFQTPKVDGYMCELAEPWIFDLLQRILPVKTGAFLDVGANLGQTLIVVKALDSKRRYVGLEPNPICAAYVDRLININRLQNAILVPVGLGKANSILKLQLYSGNTVDPSASLVDNFRPEQSVSHTLHVPVFEFAELKKAVGFHDLGVIKIDVEGSEADVIATLEAALTENAPWLVVEILPCYRADNHGRIGRQGSIESILARAAYDMYRVIKRANGQLDHLIRIDVFGIHGNMGWVDYVFCPQTESEMLKAIFDVRDPAGADPKAYVQPCKS